MNEMPLGVYDVGMAVYRKQQGDEEHKKCCAAVENICSSGFNQALRAAWESGRKSQKAMEFTYGAYTGEGKRYVFIMLDNKERKLTPQEAEQMAKQLIIYASDVRLGRSTNKEEIRQYCLKNGEPDPFPNS